MGLNYLNIQQKHLNNLIMLYLALGFALGSFTTFAVMAASSFKGFGADTEMLQKALDESYQQGYSDGYWRGRKQGGDKEPSMESLAISPN